MGSSAGLVPVSYTHLDVYKRQVYQKDLGKKTDVVAKAMKEYNPDSSWQKSEEQQEESAGEQKTK